MAGSCSSSDTEPLDDVPSVMPDDGVQTSAGEDVVVDASASAGGDVMIEPDTAGSADTSDTGADVDAACAESCATLRYECGEHCGSSCGQCAEASELCVDNQCVCQPDCPLSRCGTEDGCGALCAPCPSGVTCADCRLRLEILDRQDSGERLSLATLAVEYAPDAADPRPTLAEIRLRITGPASVADVRAGEPLETAGKALALDPDRGRPWIEGVGGLVRIVVLATDNTETISGGRWMEISLRGSFSEEPGPVVVRFEHDEPIFAPPPAEATLGDPALTDPIALW